MKTKEYVIKYKLSVSDKFNHNLFVEDLTYEFLALLDFGEATENIKGFNNAVNAIRMKFDAINNKTLGEIPEKLWNYFFATVVVKTKEKLFPEIIARQKEFQKERKEAYERRRKADEDIFNSFFGWSFLSFLSKNKTIPKNELILLGFKSDEKPTNVEINTAFKKMDLIHHPDKGGKQEDFISISEAKNKLLNWVA